MRTVTGTNDHEVVVFTEYLRTWSGVRCANDSARGEGIVLMTFCISVDAKPTRGLFGQIGSDIWIFRS